MSALRFVVMASLVTSIALGTAAAQQYPTQRVRQEWPDEHYLPGLLTWDASVGGIDWDVSDEPSQDLAAPAQDTASRIVNDQLGAKAPPYVFKSDPLPRTLRLNVSRHLQLDLITKSCSEIERVELVVRGNLVAGGYFSTIDWARVAPDHAAPSTPKGWNVCYYRMPPEVRVLEAASILELRIVHSTSQPASLKLSGEGRSVLRLPFYSAEEIAFRYPPSTGRNWGGVEADGPARDLVQRVLGPLLPWGLALALGTSRPTRRHIGTAAAALALLTSGCAAPSGPGPRLLLTGEGSPSPSFETWVEPGNDELSEASWSTILGQVRDAARVPVVEAHVFLEGTGNSTKTDSYGRFVLRNVEPGPKQLHIQHAQFLPFVQTLALQANSTLRIEATLLLREDTSKGDRPHLHDYWLPGETSREILNESLGESCVLPAYGFRDACTVTDTFTFPSDGDPPSLVVPGTYEVEITLTWDGTLPSAGLAFQANNDVGVYLARNWSGLLARPAGTPFRIQSSWEMTDLGHQTFSTWSFIITNPDGPQDAQEFHVRVVIHKGIVQLEPRHPDHWHNQDSLEVVNAEVKATDAYETTVFCASPIVPPGTGDLDLELVMSRQPTLPYHFQVRVRPAYLKTSGPEESSCFALAYYGTSAPWQDLPAGSQNGLRLSWKLPVTPGQTDGLYDQSSRWAFQVKPEGLGYTDFVVLAETTANPISYGFRVVAHRATAGET